MDEKRLKGLAETCRELLPGAVLAPCPGGLRLAEPLLYVAVEEHGRKGAGTRVEVQVGPLAVVEVGTGDRETVERMRGVLMGLHGAIGQLLGVSDVAR